MARHKHHAGAGGYWTVHNEIRNPAVVLQADNDYCCAACIQMVLAVKGISSDQHEIAARIGIPTPVRNLTPELTRRNPTRTWRTAVFRDFPKAILFLNHRCPWIAFMKDFGTRILHAVVVDGVNDDNDLLIRDPWHPGTSYRMNPADFSDPRHGWTGIATYAKRRYRHRQSKKKNR